MTCYSPLQKRKPNSPLLECVLDFETDVNEKDVAKEMLCDFWVEIKKRIALGASQSLGSLILEEASYHAMAILQKLIGGGSKASY